MALDSRLGSAETYILRITRGIEGLSMDNIRKRHPIGIEMDRWMNPTPNGGFNGSQPWQSRTRNGI
jgi:hypothetical protein